MRFFSSKWCVVFIEDFLLYFIEDHKILKRKKKDKKKDVFFVECWLSVVFGGKQKH